MHMELVQISSNLFKNNFHSVLIKKKVNDLN